MAWRGSISRSMIAAGRSSSSSSTSSLRSPPVSLHRHLPSQPSAAPSLQHRRVSFAPSRSLGELGCTQSLLHMFSMAAASPCLTSLSAREHAVSSLRVPSVALVKIARADKYATPFLQQARCLRQLTAPQSLIGGIPQPWLGYMDKQENKLHMGSSKIEPSPTRFLNAGFANNISSFRCISTTEQSNAAYIQESSISSPGIDHPPRIKFKRLDKTAKHIMNILDKESVEKVQAGRQVPDIQPGYIIQIKVEVPENKRRVSTYKGIVIARRNAGLNTTFRLRGMIAGVSFESVYLLYSPNIKEVKVIDKKNVRRAKLYYLRDRLNPLKK